MKTFTLIFLLFLAFPAFACAPVRDSSGHIKRSSYQVSKFRAQTVCPSTGKVSKSCPGYVVDHVIPLCNCGADRPSNMQYQSIAEAKKKDKVEKQTCHGLGD